MRSVEIQREALSRAASGQSLGNYPAIIQGFTAKGIPESEINPRENVFTFHAWLALGRAVRKGEHGVRIATFVPMAEKKDSEGNVTRKAGKRPWHTTVFHVSQTDRIGEGAQS